MKKSLVNPWKWQDQLGYAQAVEIPHGTHTLYCAGQAAMKADGTPLSSDMSGQIDLSFDNLETVLSKAGYSMKNVVRLNFYTTSIEQFFAAYGQVIERLRASDCVASSTLTEVNALAFPQLQVELEATAVR
ncbi:RidA family protein [Dyadobacter sandarakinus]|uniref:RidA family protein n=1 Tax=Dyadobacter sandarakinus TaxID=2747268 RepID=A0ABX7I414_9BACT|nr:RidA family protein [Dyadobacter sandarakinus]QRR00307.1 RidA family protein [Dyadobacter sandarakinus]